VNPLNAAQLIVKQPGIHTTVQDMGRTGFQDAGVPVSGPLDRVSLRLANALVGNPPDEAVLELLVQGPVLEVAGDAVRVALVGCDAVIDVGGPRPRTVPAGTSVRLERGELLRVTRLGASASACLAIEGGMAITPCLGSVATYVRGRLGGLEGRALQMGDRIPLRLAVAPQRVEKRLGQPLDLALEQPVRVVLGPQADFFTEDAIATFLSTDYAVSAQSDRMGFRLEGAALAHVDGYNIVSDGIVAGAIQVPGSGLPIVLMADAQTTGGYPKIATVISADLPALGRRRPGSKVRFAAVDVKEAQEARRQQEAWVRKLAGSLQPENAVVSLDMAALHSENLISGVARMT
jgi:biotin-dependent carboxylase-like uncharacterized protein